MKIGGLPEPPTALPGYACVQIAVLVYCMSLNLCSTVIAITQIVLLPTWHDSVS